MAKKINSNNGFDPVIKRARYDQLTIYEISDTELHQLEQGTPESIYLNFAIFLLSIAIAFSISLLTTEIKSIKTYAFFISFTIIGYIIGILLLCLWRRSRKNIKSIIDTIKERLPPEGIVEQIPKKTAHNRPLTNK